MTDYSITKYKIENTQPVLLLNRELQDGIIIFMKVVV